VHDVIRRKPRTTGGVSCFVTESPHPRFRGRNTRLLIPTARRVREQVRLPPRSTPNNVGTGVRACGGGIILSADRQHGRPADHIIELGVRSDLLRDELIADLREQVPASRSGIRIARIRGQMGSLFPRIESSATTWRSGLDEPRGPDRRSAERVLLHRPSVNSPVAAMSNHEGRSSACSSPRGGAHPRGTEISQSSCSASATFPRLDDALLHREQREEDPGEDRVRAGRSRPLRGVDSSVASGSSPQGDRRPASPASSSTTGCCAAGKRRRLSRTFRGAIGLRLDFVDASARFLKALRRRGGPGTKRKIIGKLFVRIFEEERRKIPGVGFPCTGDPLPGRDRERIVKGPRRHKVPPQRGGASGRGTASLKLVEPLARAVPRTRCAHWAGARGAPRGARAATVPVGGSRGPHSRPVHSSR